MLEIRPSRGDADELRSLEIFNTVWPRDAVGVDEMRSFKEQVAAWHDDLAWVDGEAVGSAFTAIRRERPDRALVLLTVAGHARRRGVGSALYRSASAWAAGRGLQRLETIVEEDDDESLAFAETRRFVEHERNRRVVLDLAALDPLPVDAPDGVEIVTWAERPELEQDLFEIYLEGAVDIPGSEDDELPTYDEWLRHSMAGAGDRPEAVFVAVANGQAVGYAKFSLHSVRPRVAFHDLTAVRRAWRGRGIAGALKRAQIAWAKERGYDELQTENELRNEPIRRLNERLGYRPVPGRIFLVGPLATDG